MGWVTIGATLGILPVDLVMELASIIFIFFLHVKLIDKSAIVVKLLCLSGEYRVCRPMKDFAIVVTIA